jgi:hypothetical protein
MKSKVWAVFFSLTTLLAGCGSGGEDFASQDPSAQAVSPNSFDIQLSWTITATYGYSKQMRISGTCSGDMQLAQTPHTELDNSSYRYKSQTLTGVIYNDCTDGSISSRPVSSTLKTIQYDANELDAYMEVDNKYGVWQSAPTFPTAAKVGDSGNIGEIALYDLNSHEGIGKEVWTYSVAPDTATTVIFNLVKTSYQASDLGHPTKTERNKYRVVPDDSLHLISIHWVDDSGFVFHAQ